LQAVVVALYKKCSEFGVFFKLRAGVLLKQLPNSSHPWDCVGSNRNSHDQGHFTYRDRSELLGGGAIGAPGLIKCLSLSSNQNPSGIVDILAELVRRTGARYNRGSQQMRQKKLYSRGAQRHVMSHTNQFNIANALEPRLEIFELYQPRQT